MGAANNKKQLGEHHMNFVLAFIAFNFIIIVHELGHFIAAKKFGIRVLEFSLFIGPRLISFKRGETTYSLRLFPIMAFVKLEGEEEASDSERAYRNKPRYARAIVAAAAPVANLLTAVVILTAVFSLMGFSTTRVESVQPGKPAYEAGIRKGDRLISYAGKRTYLPMDVVQFMYIADGNPAVVEVLRDGGKFTATVVPELIPKKKVYRLGIAVPEATGRDSNLFKAVYPGSAAEKAGIKVNDRIVGLNGRNISSKAEIDEFMKENGEKPIKVTVLRDGGTVVLDLTPMAETIPEQYELGINFSYKRGNLPEAFRQSLAYTYSVVRSVGYSLLWLVTGKVSLKQMMGPVGIVSTIGAVVQQGPTLPARLLYLLQMTALFSIAVGATQFIPFPMLDGNKLLLIAVEAIRKKPIPPEKEAFISMIGFMALILLAIYAFYNDILRIISGG